MSEAYNYPYDPTGAKVTNLVKDFPITLDRTGARAFALSGPFYGLSLKVRNKLNQSIVLEENKDYRLLYIHEELFGITDGPVFSIVHFYNTEINGDYLADFQMLGGNNQGNASIIDQMINNIENDSRDVYLENIIDFPSVLPPEGHLHHIANTYGYENAIDVFTQILAYLRAADVDLGLNITNQVNGINDMYNYLLQLISDLEQTGDDSTQTVSETISDLQDALASLAERVATLEFDTKNFATTTTATLDKFNAEIKANRDNLAAYIKSNSEALVVINQTLTVYAEQFTSLNQDISNILITLEQHTNTFTNHQSQIDELKNRATKNETDIENLGNLIEYNESRSLIVTWLLDKATTMPLSHSHFVARHNGNHILPLLTDAPTGHTIRIMCHQGYAPVFVVNKASTERIQYMGQTDTSVKLQDIYSMTFVKLSSTIWGLYA